MRDVDRFLLLIARHHAHQLSHLLVQVVPIQDHRHGLTEQLCSLAANCSSAIRNRDDRQRLRPASIVLLELPPYTFYPRDHLLAHYIDPCREIGKAACRLFHQPDLGVHTLRLALHCGRVRPLPPTRFLLFDLNRIRQQQDFLTLRVIPIHLRHDLWPERGSRVGLTLALPLLTDLYRFGHHQVLNRLVTEHGLPRDALQEPRYLVVAHAVTVIGAELRQARTHGAFTELLGQLQIGRFSTDGALEPLHHECKGPVQGLDGDAPCPVTTPDAPFFTSATNWCCANVNNSAVSAGKAACLKFSTAASISTKRVAPPDTS